MDDLKNLQMMIKVLHVKKERHVAELRSLDFSRQSKVSLVERMTKYKRDYQQCENLKVSKSIPSLSRNLNMFTDKIDKVIEQAMTDIKKLETSRDRILDEIMQLNQKIEAMLLTEKKLRDELKYRLDKIEQSTLDDLSLIKIFGDHNG